MSSYATSNINLSTTLNTITVLATPPQNVVGSWDKKIYFDEPTNIKRCSQYIVTCNPGNITQTLSVDSNQSYSTTTQIITIPSLVSGVTYTATMVGQYYNSALSASFLTDVSTQSSPFLIGTIGVSTRPRNVIAIPLNTQASISWTGPSNRGSSTNLNYTITSVPALVNVSTNQGNITVTGLTNGISYKFIVVAINTVGSSPSSVPSNAIVPSGVPNAPTNVTSFMNTNSQVIVSWVASIPVDSPVTKYSVYNITGNIWHGATYYGTSAICNNQITSGMPSNFTVIAENAIGASVPSLPSGNVPAAPTSVSATLNNRQASISWIAPVNTGNSAITGYTVTRDNDPNDVLTVTTNGSTTTALFSELKHGRSYTFYVRATNSNGTSYRSSLSSSITTATTFLPDAPTEITCSIGNMYIDLLWNKPYDGGAWPSILYYTIQYSSNNGINWTDISSQINYKSVTNLTNGVSNIFRISTTTSFGTGAYSSNISAYIPFNIVQTPIITKGKPGNQSVLVYFTQVNTSGVPITKYRYTLNNGGTFTEQTTTTSPLFITNLTNGVVSNIKISAYNNNGWSNMSNSLPIKPNNVPNAPVSVTATLQNEKGNISWIAPVYTGDSAIISYTAISNPDNLIATTDGSTTTTQVTGLAHNTSYTFSVVAANSKGRSYTSSDTSPITLNIVEIPVITTGELGNTCVSVFFTQVNTAGVPITKYRYTLDNGETFTENTTTISPLFIKNLTNGVLSNIKISAYTQIGWSNVSNSLSITPVDDRSDGIKTAITNLSASTITALKNQLFTDISSLDLNKKIQKINSLALDISGTSANLRVSTLLNIALNIGATTNSIKSNLNNLMIDTGLTKNVPYIISDSTLVNKIISDVPVGFKNVNWVPTSIAVVVPNNNFLTIDLNQPNFLLLFVPDVKYTVNATYSGNTSSNNYSIVYNRTDTTRTLTINGSPNKKTIGDTIIFWFPNAQLNFKINMLGSPGGEQILLPGGTGDPHILTVNGHEYMLPHNEKCYLLYDNNIENHRVIVTAKCWFLSDDIKNNSKFKKCFNDRYNIFQIYKLFL